ncbi:MAG TPA: hypothetical protein VMH03_10765 [Terriglobales bacterium]|nr:hypothetical protein [Terriglobales bacterium]
MTVSFVPLLTFSNRVRPDSCVPMLLSHRNALTRCRRSLVFFLFLLTAPCAFSQGGPPYYTNDPGTPGNLNWEINLGYMPFFYSGHSVSHVPDVDINFGLGDRIQLTYENAWLRVQNPFSETKFGLGQSNPGLKWRFYDGGESGLSVSVFPQAFLNNPNHAVRRGITSPNDSFELPAEFSKKLGPVDVDFEIGYQFVHNGPDGWLTGLVVGHDFTPKLEMDMELYALGTFHPSESQPSIDFGARYKIHRPVICSSWPDAAWNPRAALSPTSSATSASNSYCLPVLTSNLSAAKTKGWASASIRC